MLGILFDGFAIVIGSIAGIIIKKSFKNVTTSTLFQVMGILTITISLIGITSNMVVIDHNTLNCNNVAGISISVIAGYLAGELLRLEDRICSLSDKLENVCHTSNLSKSLITGYIFFGVGALQIIGPINSLLLHNNNVLITKGVIDFPFAVAFGISLGIGVMFSALPIMVTQLLIGILAIWLKQFFTSAILMQLNAVGYIILLCVGVNMAFDRSVKIKTVNLMPSILIIFIMSIFKFRL